MTILSLFGNGFPIDSYVFLPIITALVCGPAHVIFLNIFKSGGRFQGNLPLRPIPKFRDRPTTISKGIEFIY